MKYDLSKIQKNTKIYTVIAFTTAIVSIAYGFHTSSQYFIACGLIATTLTFSCIGFGELYAVITAMQKRLDELEDGNNGSK